MKITIAERLRPFSHLPGASCVIPWSSYKVQAFPAKLIFENLNTFEKQEVPLDWRGPVKEFTLELDLEKGVVWVYGKTAQGHRRVCIEMQEAGIAIDKKPILFGTRLMPHSMERLSLGMSKKLDWELVSRRQEMAEILPVWFRLGQMVPPGSEAGGKAIGTAALLQECEKLDVADLYLKVFLTGFEGILCPRLSDTSHQGILPERNFSESPLILLTEGVKYIRALFFKETVQNWDFLPCLSPEFHAGRIVDLTTKAGDKIDFEWSKKSLQKVVVQVSSSREMFFCVPKPFKSCRLRTALKEKGSRHLLEKPLRLEPSQKLFLDRFEK
jgi:hypothetical protein